MHVVVMGCGRVGSSIAHSLDVSGHSVAVVDQNADAFRRLSPDFSGTTVTGVGFDRDTLVEAGIERADAFAAVSSGDNSNIISARVARETFGVQTVVARIYDPRRAEVYTRLGIPTVATVRFTADQMLRQIVGSGAHSEWVDPTGHVVLAQVAYDEEWIGRSIGHLESALGVRVAFLGRGGEAVLVEEQTALQDADLLHVLCARDDLHRVESLLRTAD